MSIRFRTTIVLLFCFAVVVGASPLLAEPENPAKPNIVLVLMDNFGYGEIGVYGGGVLRGAATPIIDSLAEEEAENLRRQAREKAAADDPSLEEDW